MKYTIDENVCLHYGMTLSEVLLFILYKLGVPLDEVKKSLVEKEAIIHTNGQTMVTPRWDDIMCNIVLDSEKVKPETEDVKLETLAKTLIDIFPKGKKDGTNKYWRSNVKDTKLRLKKFFKLYGDKYTYEQIIEATKDYVQSFNGNYSFMRVLKYFIWKDVRKIDSDGNGYIEEVSDLADYIDNLGQDNTDKDWTTRTI